MDAHDTRGLASPAAPCSKEEAARRLVLAAAAGTQPPSCYARLPCSLWTAPSAGEFFVACEDVPDLTHAWCVPHPRAPARPLPADAAPLRPPRQGLPHASGRPP
jgi:hypothetical protein